MSVPDFNDTEISNIKQLINIKNRNITDFEKKNSIFVSHSRRDSEGNEFFTKIFADSNTSGYWYSNHQTSPPHCEKIINVMRTCKSLFVILSSEMSNSHTSTWVSFEVGVAKALKLNVWVFENPNRIAINTPVPGADAYIQFPDSIPDVDSHGYKKIIDQAGQLLPTNDIQELKRLKTITSFEIKYISKSNPRSLFINNPLSFYKFGHMDVVKCMNVNCSQVYFMALLPGIVKFHCPACRRETKYEFNPKSSFHDIEVDE